MSLSKKEQLARLYRNYHDSGKPQNEEDFDKYVMYLASYGAKNGKENQIIHLLPGLEDQREIYERVLDNIEYHISRAEEYELKIESKKGNEGEGYYISGWVTEK